MPIVTDVITGGSGFLGRHVARYLTDRGRRVVVADITPSPYVTQSPSAPEWATESVTLDLRRASDSDLDALLGSADVVYHFAWSTIPQTANADPITDLDENVGATLRLLEALRRRGLGTLVFPSSGGTVYGQLIEIPAKEDHPLNPITAYGASKVAAEKYLGVFRHLYGVDARIARLSNPFGAGQSRARPQGSATHFIDRALSGLPIEIWGDGSIVRDFIHIADAVMGLVSLGQESLQSVRNVPTVNIGSGSGVSLNEIVKSIEDILGRKLVVQRSGSRAFDIPISVLDITRARDLIGWSPRLSFAEGVSRTVADLQADRDRALSTL